EGLGFNGGEWSPGNLGRIKDWGQKRMKEDLSLKKWARQLGSARRIFRKSFATRPVRLLTSVSSGIGSRKRRRCCVPPKGASWMSRSPAASKPSSTLLAYSARCAEPVRRNIDTNPYAEISNWVCRSKLLK